MSDTTGTTVAEEPRTPEDAPTPYLDPLPVPPVIRAGGQSDGTGLEIELREALACVHSELPPTTVWGYEGQVPGPTIEVRRDERIRISWRNGIAGTMPVTAVEVPFVPGPGAVQASTRPGREGAAPVKAVADLPAWTVTHVHGAVTGGGNDGWAENAVVYGDAQLSEYPNAHRATAWWYHDHAMNITRWNVFAGLLGMYLVRDAEEDALGLPSGAYEIPLIVADRNFDTDEDGRLTGDLLHKTLDLGPDPETGKHVTFAFTGPYTLVNGVLWPHLDVGARWYRFRLLNASNARTYNLVLLDEHDRVVSGAVHQIGSDGGLLPRPVALDFGPGRPQLTVAPAERMDLLVDFRALRGTKARLVNVATAPPGQADPPNDLPFPQVMEFRVGEEPRDDPFELPAVLSPSFRRIAVKKHHRHRLVVITEPGTTGGGGHPELWEMQEVPNGSVSVPSDGVIQLTGQDGTTRTYRRAARTFDDTLGFKASHGDLEVWNLLNISRFTHPLHVHLADFQLLERQPVDSGGFDLALGGTRTPVVPDTTRPVPVAPNEQGWKDVFRVPGHQMVTVAGRFTGAYGRFMYHCHLLEHEDMGMMRPFVVMPPEVMVFDHHMPDHDH
ncbi:multicopper oxidase domain-containing protein [Streptomyces sp. AV19]|uniref:multicopper oxidase domain-containing protein n=1 Tax=Streptomyces sp. AV19 TaxID=2793068 RepID=UPI001F3A397E|nr:multicopper oxidase domain-containing protein [Streptomyces sp. AV19]MDG4533938.1 multicopper oxidase domain-containing protein [Streptomyces sp. AV19]